MDIEWAKDGEDGTLYIVQARPETVASRRSAETIETYAIKGSGTVLVTGRAVGEKIATGIARVVASTGDLDTFRPGEILVAETTTPDWQPVMKTAAAIVTNRGGRTCHAAIVARELGVPAVVGTGEATATLADRRDGHRVLRRGRRRAGLRGRHSLRGLEHRPQRPAAGRRPRSWSIWAIPTWPSGRPCCPAPASAWRGWSSSSRSISASIPWRWPSPPRSRRRRPGAAIARADPGLSPQPADFFVERLSEGVGTIAAAFYPRPVIVRLSDFKTNEYAGLIGGAEFEPKEDNPMLGFRGASRYDHPAYAAASPWSARPCAGCARRWA